jgi:hypothetical protein
MCQETQFSGTYICATKHNFHGTYIGASKLCLMAHDLCANNFNFLIAHDLCATKP